MEWPFSQIKVTNQECKLLQKGPIIYRSIVDGKIEKPTYVKKLIEVLNNRENIAFEYLFQTKVKKYIRFKNSGIQL